MTCHHGLEFLCSQCRKEDADLKKSAVSEGRAVYAIFEWRGDGKYRLEERAVEKTYKVRSAAEKQAEKLGMVVRFVYI